MKPIAIMTALLVVIIIIVAPACHADDFEAVRKRIERLVDSGKVPSMAVAVARGGRILWEEGIGLADRERGIPATEHTIYPLASVTKPLTATGLMVLVERGRIDPDRPVNDYLGDMKLQARVGVAAGATVRRVAGHMAGLPLHANHFYSGEPDSPPVMEETIRRYGVLVSAPGERYQYSNLGYGLLGHVISRVSALSYADFMQREVFAPLGMDRTLMQGGCGLKPAQAVKYTPDGKVVPPCASDAPGAGAICASVHDLILFAMFHLKTPRPGQRAVIGPDAIDRMQQPVDGTGPMQHWEQMGSGCGIGWRIGIAASGLKGIYHGGGTHGVSTALALVPEENLAVAVLSNTHGPWPETILVEILQLLLPEKSAGIGMPKTGRDPEPPFAPGLELVGIFQGAVHTHQGQVPMVLDISASGSVSAALEGQPPAHLKQVSYRKDFPRLKNAGNGPFLRGWMQCDLAIDDVTRGRPSKLWLELKLRDGRLCGSLIALSQRENPTGPLSYWVALKRRKR